MLSKEEVKRIKIKAIMEEIGMKDVAKMVNVTNSMLSQILLGKKSSVRVENQLRAWINEK